MKLFTRTLSIILALVILGTTPVFSVGVFAAETDQSTAGASAENAGADADAENVSIGGTNSFGEMVSDKLDEQQAGEENGNRIYQVAVEGKQAEVEVQAMTNAKVILAIYDEASGKMLGSGMTEITPEEKIAELDLKIDTMPEFFEAKAYLVDSETNVPLCKQYECNTYTSKMQAFLAKTTDDFDEEKVVNLDSDKKNNFVVYNDKTVIVDEKSGHNVVAEADPDNKKYVIKNIDEKITSLKQGDILSYPRGGDMLIIKVSSIEINGSTATIYGGELELEDVFDYIKIDERQGIPDEDSAVGSNSGEGIKPKKAPDPVGSIIDISEIERVKSRELKYTFEELGGDRIGAEGSFTIKAESSVKCIFDPNLFEKDECEVTFSVKLELGLTAKFELNLEDENAPIRLEMKPIKIPVLTGVTVDIIPAIVLQGKIDVEISGLFTAEVGKSFKNGKFSDISKKPHFEPELKIEGEIFFGLSLTSELDLLSETVTAGVEVLSGVAISAKTQYGGDAADTEDEHHECITCIEGELVWKLEITAKVSVFDNKKFTFESKLLPYKIKLKDFYYSSTTNKFEFTSCPNHTFRQTIRLWNEDGLPIEGVFVNNEVTNELGFVTFYFTKGKQKILIKNGDFRKGFELDVEEPGDMEYVLSGNEIKDKNGSVISTYEHDNSFSGNCGHGVMYTYDGKGFLVISGDGEMNDYDSADQAPWFDISDEITSINIRDGVKSIGDNAFEGYENLKSVNIAYSVKRIGDCTFANCPGLTSMILPLTLKEIGNYAFLRCENLKKVVTPGAVSIGDGAFIRCVNIESIEIPDSVTELGVGAFGDCENLKSAKIGDRVVKLDYTFENCVKLETVKLGKSVGNVNLGTFENCESLVSIDVVDGNEDYFDVDGVLYSKSELIKYPPKKPDGYLRIPDGVEVIKPYALTGSRNLKYVLFADSVREICDHALAGCTNLTNAVFARNTKRIGAFAFSGCEKLTSITLPKGITNIDEFSFSDCEALESISLPDNPINIKHMVFYHTAFYYNPDNRENGVLYIGKHLISSDSDLSDEYKIKDGTLSVADYALSKKEFTEVIIPDTVEIIGANAFNGCYNLENAIIPNGVTSIGAEAFCNCTSLATVNLPDSITSIGNSAYKNTAYYNNKSNWTNGALYIGKHLIAAENCPSDKCNVKSGTLTIADNAFNGPKSVYFPESVRSIGSNIFNEYLEIKIADGNTNYPTINGNIYNKDRTVLLRYDPNNTASEFVVPTGVKTIGTTAFSNCENLTGITIVGDVSTIEDGAFSDCPNLTYLTIGRNVKRIGNFLFYYFNAYTAPSEIYYEGSAEEWKKIKLIDEMGLDHNYPLQEATIYYNSTRVIRNSYSSASDNVEKKPAADPVGASVLEDKFTRSGLVPDSEALLMIVEGRENDYEISDTSLIYVAQTTVGKDGTATFENRGDYLNKNVVVLIFGRCMHKSLTKISASDCVLTVCDDCGEVIRKSTTLTGDVNLDGAVNINDATDIQRYLARLKEFSDEQIAAADTDGNGNITIQDATQIQKYLAKLVPVLG